MKRLVVDTANLLFRVASAHGKYNAGADTKDQAGLAMHMALMALRAQYNKYKPDQVAITFEGGNNWRKAHTRGLRNTKPVSGILYKGNRVKDDSMIPYFELMDAFKKLAAAHTSLVVLQHNDLEGDDLFAGYARKYSALGDEVIGLSDDKDFVQLLQLPNFKLVRPDGTLRGLDKDTKEPIDPKFFMYEKAFRGDMGDNVISAFPKVRKTKLQAAYDGLKRDDGYAHDNLMGHTWDFTHPETGHTKTMLVRDLYAENIMLMDLINGQPADVQQLMVEAIEAGEANRGVFNLFQFQKFCGQYDLRKISDEVTTFIPMLSGAQVNDSQAAKVSDAVSALRAQSKAKIQRAKTTLVF